MYHTYQAVAIGNQHAGDMTGLPQVQRINGQRAGTDADSASRHHFGNTGVTHINAGIKYAAQIAIGEDADDIHFIIANGGHA